ncbi:MAG: hypothetical protein H7Z19_16650 [Chitinophagaceae bacterium]|nr:hypothetical protein [Rubrivivax sp.]
MRQSPLALAFAPTSAPAADSPGDPCERRGFQVGWDHAQHDLVPPPELLLSGTPLCQGWLAGKAVFRRRTLNATRSVRLWLQLRITAWRHDIHFEGQQVTPHYLAQLHVDHCPVTRQTLGGAAGDASSAVLERLNPLAGYAAGNLVTMSLQAAQARVGVTVAQAVRHARRIEVGDETVTGLDASAWWRLAALMSFAVPASFHESARLPLAVLPPNRVRLLNAAQGLQALVTRQFGSPGWSARTRGLAAMLPEHTLRHDFNLFIGALAPRALEAGTEPRALRQALEDAWLQDRVQRRWQHFVLSLGAAACETLLERAAGAGLAGVRTVPHAPAQSIEGWGLEPGSRAPSQRAAGFAFTAARPPKNRSATSGARLS